MPPSGVQIAVDSLRAVDARIEGRVLDVLRPLPQALTVSERASAQRWMLGLRWLPWPRTFTERTIDDCTPVQRTEVDLADDEVDQVAFQVDQAVQCSTIVFRFDEARQMLMENASIYQSPALAAHLMNAAVTRSLPNDAQAQTTAIPPVRAVGRMEDLINTGLKGALGVLYTPSTVLAEAYWAFDDDDDGDEGPSGISTILGHSVVVDPVFGGAPTGQSSAASETWIYGSGPIWGAVSEPHIDGDDWQHVDYATNTATLRVQFEGIVAYDPNTVYAQKVCLTGCV